MLSDYSETRGNKVLAVRNDVELVRVYPMSAGGDGERWCKLHVQGVCVHYAGKMGQLSDVGRHRHVTIASYRCSRKSHVLMDFESGVTPDLRTARYYLSIWQ